MSHHQSHVQTSEKAATLHGKQAMETDGGPLHSTVNCATHEAIAQRAYDIYIKSGSQTGHCNANWKAAEDALNHASNGCEAPTTDGTSPHEIAALDPVAKAPASSSPSLASKPFAPSIVPTGTNSAVRSASTLNPPAKPLKR